MRLVVTHKRSKIGHRIRTAGWAADRHVEREASSASTRQKATSSVLAKAATATNNLIKAVVPDDKAQGAEACDYCALNMFAYQARPDGGGSWIDYITSKTGCKATRPAGDNLHGHHIVMKGTKYTESEKARQILCKYGINPYTDCKNLVIAVNHCHSTAYAKETLEQLDTADKEFGTPKAIEQALISLITWHKNCGETEKADENDD